MYNVPRPCVVFDPPDEPLWAAFDLADTLLAGDRSSGELETWLHIRIQDDLDPFQPACQLVLDAAHERLCESARAPEGLAHSAYGKAELPRIARFRVGLRRNGSGERDAAREVRREWDGERRV